MHVTEWVGLAVTVIAALGGMSGMAALRSARAAERKVEAEKEKLNAEKENLKAEAASKIVEAATTLVDPLRAEVKRLDDAHRGLHIEVSALKADAAAQYRSLMSHALWDRDVVYRLAEVGIEIPDAPPLFPGMLQQHHHRPLEDSSEA